MANKSLILAKSSDGREITVKDCEDYLRAKDREKLSDFIFDRLYGRYLKPFDFSNDDYTENYKNGFALMASCCLLIETYVSFREKEFRDTEGKSRKTFGYFFTTETKFSEFATGGRKADGTIAERKDGGTPNDFYENVRCGILHNAEIKNGWMITRKQNKVFFDPKTKTINATKFANRLKAVLKNYKRKLLKSNFDTDDIWDNFKNRLDDLIKNS